MAALHFNSIRRKVVKSVKRRLTMTVEAERKPVGWKPVALDGGYGWVVVFGSFLIHVFADGFVYSFGVIAETIVKEFNCSNAEVSVILSLLTGLMLAAGPVASAVCNRIGCRLTTIIGAVIASAGCAASYFATSTLYLIISVGIVMGTGFGFMYCPAIIIVTMYFEKYRSLATGVTVCGAGVGTAVFGVLIGVLMNSFGWRNVFLIYAGIVLLCVPVGCLYRPVEFAPIYDDEEDESSEAGTKPLHKDNANEIPPKKSLDIADVETPIRAALSHNDINAAEGGMKTIPEDSQSVSSASNLARHKSLGEGIASKQRERADTKTESSGYLNVKDVFYPGSVTALKEYEKEGEKFRSVSSLHSHTLSVKERHRSASTKEAAVLVEEDESEENLDSQATSASRAVAIWHTITKILDLSLFADPVYLLFAISNFLTSIGFNAPPMFMPMLAERSLGLTSASAGQTVSFYGIANIVGRIVFGLVSDRQLPFSWGKDVPRNRLWIYNWALMITGVISCVVFLMTDALIFKGYCFVFGFLISSYVCLTSVVLVDMVGVDRLTSAFGLLLLVQGVATFVGPPIAGKLYDMTGRYDYTFGFCGVCLFISGIMLFAVPLLQKNKAAPVRLDNGTKEAQKSALLH